MFYDADCGFCRWSLAQILALDRERRLRPLPLDGPEADALLGDLSPEERAASWHLIAPDGTRSSAGPAAPRLFRLLAGGRVLGPLFGAVPSLTNRGYQWVAEHRSLLSRTIPSEAKRRADQRIASRGTT